MHGRTDARAGDVNEDDGRRHEDDGRRRASGVDGRDDARGRWVSRGARARRAWCGSSANDEDGGEDDGGEDDGVGVGDGAVVDDDEVVGDDGVGDDDVWVGVFEREMRG